MPQNHLIDANVILEAILEREYAEEANACIDLFDGQNGLDAWIAPHTLSIIYYVGRKEIGKTEITKWIKGFLQHYGMTPLTAEQSLKAFEFGMSDFEDAMQASSAVAINAKSIITFNIKDFKKSPIPAITPQEFVSSLS